MLPSRLGRPPLPTMRTHTYTPRAHFGGHLLLTAPSGIGIVNSEANSIHLALGLKRKTHPYQSGSTSSFATASASHFTPRELKLIWAFESTPSPSTEITLPRPNFV